MAGMVIKAHWRVTASNVQSYQEGDLEFQVPGEPEDATGAVG
jgi:hypothetical protein